MNKIKLSEEIFKSLDVMGFELGKENNIDRVMKYYLEKNIETIFGKNEFIPCTDGHYPGVGIENYIDIQKNIGQGRRIQLYFTYMGELYDISVVNNSVLSINDSNGLLAKIKKEGNVLVNYMFTKDRGLITSGLTYKTKFSCPEVFSCVKTENKNGVIETNVGYSLRAAGAKCKTKEYFSLMKEIDGKETEAEFKKSFLHRLLGLMTDGRVVEIEEYSQENDVFDCLETVFTKLEEYCDKEESLKK